MSAAVRGSGHSDRLLRSYLSASISRAVAPGLISQCRGQILNDPARDGLGRGRFSISQRLMAERSNRRRGSCAGFMTVRMVNEWSMVAVFSVSRLLLDRRSHWRVVVGLWMP